MAQLGFLPLSTVWSLESGCTESKPHSAIDPRSWLRSPGNLAWLQWLLYQFGSCALYIPMSLNLQLPSLSAQLQQTALLLEKFHQKTKRTRPWTMNDHVVENCWHWGGGNSKKDRHSKSKWISFCSLDVYLQVLWVSTTVHPTSPEHRVV